MWSTASAKLASVHGQVEGLIGNRLNGDAMFVKRVDDRCCQVLISTAWLAASHHEDDALVWLASFVAVEFGGARGQLNGQDTTRLGDGLCWAR